MLTFGERRRGGNCNEVRSQSGGQLFIRSRSVLTTLLLVRSRQGALPPPRRRLCSAARPPRRTRVDPARHERSPAPV
jgi:hypothetical protein